MGTRIISGNVELGFEEYNKREINNNDGRTVFNLAAGFC
jgi:hypothetical protein